LSLTTHDGDPKLVYWKGGFWLWHNGAYDEVRPEEMRTQIAKRIGQDYTNPKKSHVSDVLEYLAGEASVSSRREAPFWIREPHPDHAPSRCLTFRNGIFPMDQLLAGECDLLLPPTPNLFTPYALPVDYCPDLEAPERFLAFLRELWPDDEESIAALRQWFGYALLPDTSRQKIFCIIGPPRSGKGTIARVLEAMVGKRNVVWPSMSGLAGRFGMEQLVGKSLAICGETKVSGRFDATVALERLLGISGEDSVTIDRKNRPPLTCRLGTRFLLLGNDIPTFSDQSGAFASRLVMLATEHSFAAKQNRKLTAELLRELPEITNWAMFGWYLLQQADSFIQPSLGDELIEEVRASGAGVSQFVADRCVVEPGAVAYAKDLFAAWKEWCADEGRGRESRSGGDRDQVGTRSWLIRNLRAAYPKLRSLRERQSGEQLRGLSGIRLK
jgi:putative DNA primase/helicase